MGSEKTIEINELINNVLAKFMEHPLMIEFVKKQYIQIACYGSYEYNEKDILDICERILKEIEN